MGIPSEAWEALTPAPQLNINSPRFMQPLINILSRLTEVASATSVLFWYSEWRVSSAEAGRR